MPRPEKPARLWQRRDDGAWIILDKGRQVRTSDGRGEREEAEEALGEYLSAKTRQRSSPARPSDITVGEILARLRTHKRDSHFC